MSVLPLSLAACVARPPAAPAAPQLPFTFAVVGDRTDEPNDGAWRDILGQVEARKPQLVLTVGDLADDALDPGDWDTALAGTALLSAPVAYTPGNHDILDEATAAVFTERTGQAPYRAFEQGGVRFVIVDNSIAESWDQLPEVQQTWLEAELVAHADAPVVVAMHKPFWAVLAAAGQPDPMHELFVRTGVDAVFTGHWHQHLYQQVDGIPYVGVGTSGGAFGGVQDPRLGNAYEYVWGEVRDGRFVLRAVAGGVDLPIDYLTRADSGRLRALRQGAVTGVARGDAIEIRIHNVTDAPLAGVLTVEPSGWTVANPTVPYEVAPGETFTATVPASAPAGWFPSPRLSLSYPLPDAGPVAFVTPVDAVREAVAPRGAAVVDGRLDDWAGAPSVGPLTTALGGLATTEATEVWLRHDDEALYVAARCADSEPAQLSRLHTDRDRQVVFDDRIGLLLFPTPDQLVWFYVNPNGAVWDLRRVGADLQRGWDGVEAAATVDEGGYSVEARIPFAALGLGEVPQTWSFDLRRRQERTQSEATFTSAFASRDPARIGILHLSP